MIRWGAYLQMLEEDGVTYDCATHYLVGEDGRPKRAWFLCRQRPNQKPLVVQVPELDLTAEVPAFQQRRIANSLALPPEKYILSGPLR